MFLPLHDANIIRHIRFPYVTYGLIGLTTLCFLLQALQPQAAFDQLTINFQHGKAEAMQEVAKAAKKPTEARAVIQTGMVIAGADGHFSQAEATVLREACATLGLSPAEFQL